MGKKKSTHYYGKGPTKIHTDRDPPSCRKKKQCKFQENGTKLPGVTRKRQNPHHIIPVSVLIAYKDDTEKSIEVRRRINSVYRGTDYCANHEGNIIWLPTKKAYVNLARRTVDTSAAFAWGYGLPCHTWDHPQYTIEARKEIDDRLWIDFGVETVAASCPDPERVRAELKDLEDDLRDELVRRGKRVEGGVTAIKEHVLGRASNPDWYKNYSMANDDFVGDRPAFNFACEIARGLSRKRK